MSPDSAAELGHLFRAVPGLGQSVLLAAGYVAGAAGLAGALFEVARDRIMPRPRQARTAEHLPFDEVLKGGRGIICKDGSLAVAIAVAGLDQSGLGGGDRLQLFHARKRWIEGLAGTGVQVRVFQMRRRVALPSTVEPDHPVRQAVLEAWHDQYRASYANRHVVVLTMPGATERGRVTLEEVVDGTLTALSRYGAREIAHGNGRFSDLLSFWAGEINPSNRAADGTVPIARLGDELDPALRLLAGAGLSERLTGGNIESDVDTGLITFEGGEQACFSQIVVVQVWGEESIEEICARLLSLEGELTLLHRFSVYSEAAAMYVVKRRGDLVSSMLSESVRSQIATAEQLVSPGVENKQSLVLYELTIHLYGESPEELERLFGEVRALFFEYGIRVARETELVEPYWYAQWPSYDPTFRACAVFSQNCAEFLGFDQVSSGADRSDFGPGPILICRTVQRTPYLLQYHGSEEKEALGHMLVVGKSGAGKSVWQYLMMTGALRHQNLRGFILDRDKSALLYTLACGGRYVGIQSDLPSAFAAQLQPLQLPTTEANQAHQIRFLRMLAGLRDPESEEIYQRAVADLATIAPKDRRLEVIVDAAFGKSRAALEIQKFLKGPYAGVFNAPEDRFDVTHDRLVAFDLTTVLLDDVLAPPVVTDLFHRIRTTCDYLAAQSVILVDETQPLLRNQLFREYFLTLLQEGRKRRQVVVSMFQRPQAMEELDSTGALAGALRTQCPTWMIMPDPAANADEYQGWGLTDWDWLAIKRQLPQVQDLERYALIKRPDRQESVIIDLDLRPLGPLAAVFRTGSEYWRRGIQLFEAQPERWLEHYLDEHGGRARLRGSGRQAVRALAAQPNTKPHSPNSRRS